jgi:hypothetical protein
VRCRGACAVVLAGAVGGTVATLAQVLLWIAAGEDAWSLLLRDSRLTAALVLGEPALRPFDGFNIRVLLVATAVHYFLSLLYAAVLLRAARRLTPVQAVLPGAGFGALLYFVNLHGFTAAFPWFIVARGGITLVAHVVFGMAVTMTLTALQLRARRLDAPDRPVHE